MSFRRTRRATWFRTGDPQVEAALAEAPVNIPAVVLLNFRDKLEEDSAAKANEKPENPAKRPAQETPPSDPPEQKGEKSGAAGEVSEEGDPTEVKAEDEAGEGDAGEKAEVEGAKAGAWGHVVTLESARLMMDRVREVDVAEERGPGRRISLFDCSMKNCFGLRVRSGWRLGESSRRKMAARLRIGGRGCRSFLRPSSVAGDGGGKALERAVDTASNSQSYTLDFSLLLFFSPRLYDIRLVVLYPQRSFALPPCCPIPSAIPFRKGVVYLPERALSRAEAAIPAAAGAYHGRDSREGASRARGIHLRSQLCQLHAASAVIRRRSDRG